MISFRPKALPEAVLIQRMKEVLALCETDDFKTKKFKGLLHDHIPNETGLKVRLEILGQSGELEKLLKLKGKSQDKSSKIEKMAQQFSKVYGFSESLSYSTLILVAKALDLQVQEIPVNESSNPVVDSLKPVGNFSKKHFDEKPVNVGNLRIKTASPSKTIHPQIKKNNVLNMIKIAGFIAIMLGVYYRMLVYFGHDEAVISLIKTLPSLGVNSPWIWSFGITVILMCIMPTILYKFKKINVPSLYPVAMLLIQLIASALYIGVPEYYELLQMSICLALILSFGVVSMPSVKLPRGRTDVLAYKAILPYYLTGITFFLAQIAVRSFL